MNNQIETWRVQQYTANVYHLSQQMGSRIGPVVRTETFTGKAEYFDRLALATALKKVGRNSPTPNLDITHSRRMVTTSMYEWATLVDRKDKLQNIHDPENQYAKSAMFALGRSMDNVIINAALGTAATGESGSGTQTLGTAQDVLAVAGGVASRMNVQALLKAKLLMDQAEAVGPRYFVHTAAMLEAMLEQTQVTSADYNTVKALVRGELDTFLGFKFIHTELLPLFSATGNTADTFDPSSGLHSSAGNALTPGATTVSGFAFVGDGLLLGRNEGAVGRVDERSDYSYAHQVYASMDFGAVRMEEVKVVQVNSLP
jgi:hypothetical protein